MTLIQLDVKEGNVNDIVNESIRSTYQVRHFHLSDACYSFLSTLQQPAPASQFAVLHYVMGPSRGPLDKVLLVSSFRQHNIHMGECHV